MPERLTAERQTGGRTPGRTPAVQAVLVLGAFVAAGALAGLGWHRVWDPPTGVAFRKDWIPRPYEEGNQADFEATALYVVLALLAGLLVGALSARWLAASELVTLAAVVVGSCLAAWTMQAVGTALTGPDPYVLARTAEDGTEILGHLHVTGATPYLAFPFGALLALVVVFLAAPNRAIPVAHPAGAR